MAFSEQDFCSKLKVNIDKVLLKAAKNNTSTISLIEKSNLLDFSN